MKEGSSVDEQNKKNKEEEKNKTLLRSAVFGNTDVNTVADYFLQKMRIPKEDCPRDQSRRYWYLLLKESKTGVGGVRWLIDQAAEDGFYRNNITSSKDLYYKRVKLLTRKRGEMPTIVVMPKGGGDDGSTRKAGLAHQPGSQSLLRHQGGS